MAPIAAITAVARGQPTVGLDRRRIGAVPPRDGVRKVSARDVGLAMAQRADGATTVAASLMLAQGRRHRGLRHRRNRRRAPRAGVRRVGGSRRARADADDRRVLGREVDPRSASDVGATRDAWRRRDRISNATSCPAFTRLRPASRLDARADDVGKIVGTHSSRTARWGDHRRCSSCRRPAGKMWRSIVGASRWPWPRRGAEAAREGVRGARGYPLPAGRDNSFDGGSFSSTPISPARGERGARRRDRGSCARGA